MRELTQRERHQAGCFRAQYIPSGRNNLEVLMRSCIPFQLLPKDPVTKRLGLPSRRTGLQLVPCAPGLKQASAQSRLNPLEVSYGPLGLNLLREGKTASQALQQLIADDEQRALRQVAIVDNAGNIAVHTGDRCIAAAGHIARDNFSVQANMMVDAGIWPAMAEAYQKTTGEFEERIMAALHAAQTAGGDIRGRQSACMLVVEGEKTEEPWKHVVRNIRVDDHPEPLQELARLLKIDWAYERMNKGDEFLSKNETDAAMLEYQAAAELHQGWMNCLWEAVTLADSEE